MIKLSDPVQPRPVVARSDGRRLRFPAMNGLTGQEAAERLDRRGGQIWVFRYGHGSTYVYDCQERQGGACIVVGHAWMGEPTKHDPRLTLDTADARASLASSMEATRDRANAGVPADAAERYVLAHRDLLDTDAGYAQIGCVIALVSTVVGLIVGAILAWLLTERVEVGVLIISPIVGFLVALFAEGPLASLAVGIPALRDRIELLSVIWSVVVPGVLTAVAIVALTLYSGSGNPLSDF